ncbi:hypothetical protein ACFPRL_06290 [Pseudoclavibacter helvolus]
MRVGIACGEGRAEGVGVGVAVDDEGVHAGSKALMWTVSRCGESQPS